MKTEGLLDMLNFWDFTFLKEDYVLWLKMVIGFSITWVWAEESEILLELSYSGMGEIFHMLNNM